MFFKALACDYDGTLAWGDRIGSEALSALERARGAGLRLVLVTGRTFFELIRVCERLDLFDAAVAENGGVLYFPLKAMIRDLAPPPPPWVLAELDRRGISFLAGRVVIATARGDEARVREALASAGVQLEFVYNRDALMLLPAGVSKGAGVRHAIRELGLSFHDVLALGDAENDLDLFEACGWAGCPENAVPALRERADWVFAGHDGAGIARAIADQVLLGLLPVAHASRHQIELGWAVETSEPVTIPARGVNVLIQGDPLSGKSWLAGGLVERLVARRYAVLVIDPEGNFHVLGRLPGVSRAEIGEGSSWNEVLGHFDRDPAACVVVDLSALPHSKKVTTIEKGLALTRQVRQRLGLPHWVVLDEAHYSLYRGGVDRHVVGVEEKGFCFVTYRPSWLRESVQKAIDVFILARTTMPEELTFLQSLLGEPAGGGPDPTPVLPELPRGEFLLVRPEPSGERTSLTFVAPPRETAHVRHLRKYADTLLSPEKRFVFRRPDGQAVATAESLGDFREIVATVDERTLADHAGRGDFSRWIFGVFADRELGGQLRKIEARWRRGEIADLRRAIEALIATRYGTSVGRTA